MIMCGQISEATQYGKEYEKANIIGKFHRTEEWSVKRCCYFFMKTMNGKHLPKDINWRFKNQTWRN